MLMTQDLLDRFHIYAVLQHQCSGGVAELVGGILGAVQTGLRQVLLYQCVNVRAADPLVPAGEEQGVLIPAGDGTADLQIAFQRRLAGVVKVDDTYLVSFTKHPQGVPLNV